MLVDCGDAVVHILQPQLRLYYNLEEIWGDKPVRMKLAAGVRSLAKASEPMDEDEDEVPAARGTRRASSLRPALARLPEGMKEPSPPMGHEDTDPDAIATVRKPARKTAAKTGTKTAATKTAGTRAAAPRKTAAGTTARKTAPRTATKTATKTAGKTAGKTATKTAAAKPAARKRTTRPA